MLYCKADFLGFSCHPCPLLTTQWHLAVETSHWWMNHDWSTVAKISAEVCSFWFCNSTFTLKILNKSHSWIASVGNFKCVALGASQNPPKQAWNAWIIWSLYQLQAAVSKQSQGEWVIPCYTMLYFKNVPIGFSPPLLVFYESVAKFCSPENTTTRLMTYIPESQLFTRSLLTLLWWTLLLLWKYSTKSFLNGFCLHIQVCCRWKPVGAS